MCDWGGASAEGRGLGKEGVGQDAEDLEPGMRAGFRGGPRTEWAGPKQEEFEGPGLLENGDT